MKQTLLLLLLALALLLPHAASAAAVGTAWGTLTAPPSCSLLASGPICFLTLQAAGDSVSTLIACTASNYYAWCASLQYNENVILSFVQKPVLVESQTQVLMVPDGTTLTHYCYPGPCGR